MIIRNRIKNPSLSSSYLQRQLVTANVHVSDSTVRRRLKAEGRVARRPVKKQLLTPTMMKKRLKWAKEHREWTVDDWKKVIFSDESHFEVHGHRSPYVRRSVGEKLKPGHIQ